MDYTEMNGTMNFSMRKEKERMDKERDRKYQEWKNKKSQTLGVVSKNGQTE